MIIVVIETPKGLILWMLQLLSREETREYERFYSWGKSLRWIVRCDQGEIVRENRKPMREMRLNQQIRYLHTLLETSPYIKDLSNRWVTFDGPTVICCADTF